MFDSEESSIALNALYETGIQDDILALLHVANHENNIAVKTNSGITDRKTIHDKIMQGDVLGPLVSSNMVDGKVALETGQIYMYKNKVIIPPLTMQDDTLCVSKCGFRTSQMSEFINTRAKIMNLQFGCGKCSHMHIGKKLNEDICPSLTIDAWEQKVVENQIGEKELVDEYKGQDII